MNPINSPQSPDPCTGCYQLFRGAAKVLGISHAATEPQMLAEYAVLDVLAKAT